MFMQHTEPLIAIYWGSSSVDSLFGLVVRGPGYIPRGRGFDSLLFQIFLVVLSQERGPLRLVRISEELLESESRCSSL
jgi:hypothetical protein